METTFKYNGKIITTPNLEKKLKRMKLSMDDIEIINTPIKKEKPSESGVEDFMLNKRQVIVRSTEDDIRRVCYIEESLPTIYELFKHQLWNPETKTGINGLTKEYLMTMYYDQKEVI